MFEFPPFHTVNFGLTMGAAKYVSGENIFRCPLTAKSGKGIFEFLFRYSIIIMIIICDHHHHHRCFQKYSSFHNQSADSMLYDVSKKLANNTHIRQSRPIHEILTVPSNKYNFHSRHKMISMNLDVTVKKSLTLAPFCFS